MDCLFNDFEIESLFESQATNGLINYKMFVYELENHIVDVSMICSKIQSVANFNQITYAYFFKLFELEIDSFINLRTFDFII